MKMKMKMKMNTKTTMMTTKKQMFAATKSRVFATIATAGVMVGGVAGLEAQATEESNAQMKLQVIATEQAQQAASIDRFVHPPVVVAPTATAPKSSSRGTSSGSTSNTTPAAPATPAPPASSTGGTNGTSAGSQ
jgi:hypothetical protein